MSESRSRRWKLRTATVFARVAVSLLALPIAAQAATLTMSTDKSWYVVGDTITLTVIGDSQGAADNAIFGTIVYDTTTFSGSGGQTQSQLTSFSGGLPWTLSVLNNGFPRPNTQDAFSQLAGMTPLTVDQQLTAVMYFSVDGPGISTFRWLADGSADSLDFFGLTNAPGITVIIPEPATASLLGLALLGLCAAGRRRRHAGS